MKQTESAVRMLISAYKAVLTNCYIKENLLGGGKRLVKGAALSSFLTAVLAGVSQSAIADDSEFIDNIAAEQIENIKNSSETKTSDINSVTETIDLNPTIIASKNVLFLKIFFQGNLTIVTLEMVINN